MPLFLQSVAKSNIWRVKMRAWYFDEKTNDPRDPCVLNDRFITQVIIFSIIDSHFMCNIYNTVKL